jgi:hypothetical protein
MKSRIQLYSQTCLTCLASCLIPLCVSCQTQRPLVLQSVGPASSGTSLGEVDSRGEGFLKVFSATETRRVGHEGKYYPHTDYFIYNTNGSVFRRVENSVGPTDEAPALVDLPAGLYKIRVQADDYGRVIVPVLIEPWRTTRVYLESRAGNSSENLNPTNSVCLPDGRIVGWRANIEMVKDHGNK